jgi:hypothetical protein
MGFSEDDRIRNKNSSYTKVSTMNSDIRLRLNSISINDMVELLISGGYLIKLESDHTISISRKLIHGAKITNDNQHTGSIQSPIIIPNSATRNKDK